MRRRSWVAVMFGLACVFGSATSAFPATSLEGGFLVPTEGGENGNLLSLGMRWGEIQPSSTSAELGLGVLSSTPGTSVGFVLGATMDLDAVRAIPSGQGSFVVPRLGATVVGGAGEGGGGFGAGLVGGVGILSLPDRGAGFRADVSYRWLMVSREARGLVGVSLGWVWGKPSSSP